MLTDVIILFLRHHYGDSVLPFFDPEAVKDKEDWTWDPYIMVIVNLFSKELEALYDADDYSFEEVPNNSKTTEEDKQTKTSKGATQKMTPQKLALTRMSLVLNDKDADSFSILGNPMKLISGSPYVMLLLSLYMYLILHQEIA